MNIDFKKVSENEEVIKLLKEREEIETKIKKLDDNALINYELEKINSK